MLYIPKDLQLIFRTLLRSSAEFYYDKMGMILELEGIHTTV